MPLGTEYLPAQWLKAIQNDEGMKGFFSVPGADGKPGDGKVRVYIDAIPPVVTYPSLFLAEATNAVDLRDSESVGGVNAGRVEFRYVHCVAYGAGGELPWKMLERVRALSIDENNDTTPNPYLRADPTNDSQNVYDIGVLTADGTTQERHATMFKDDAGQEVHESTRTFFLYGRKKGGC